VRVCEVIVRGDFTHATRDGWRDYVQARRGETW
jgi:hypothetical protein